MGERGNQNAAYSTYADRYGVIIVILLGKDSRHQRNEMTISASQAIICRVSPIVCCSSPPRL